MAGMCSEIGHSIPSTYFQAHKGQEALEKKVALLEAHQKEIHDSLSSMESHALRLYQVLTLICQQPIHKSLCWCLAGLSPFLLPISKLFRFTS